MECLYSIDLLDGAALAKMKDKVILVTGANKGIGLAIAKKLLDNGAKVAVNYRENCDNLKLLAEQNGNKIALIKADVSKQEEIKNMFAQIKEKYGSLNGLVNNAGILKDSLLIMSREEDFDRLINTNLKGTFLCMQQAAKSMMRGGGSIVNISSIVGVKGNAGQCMYSATKAGVIGLTKSAAKELGQFGIRVNAIAPGVIKTDMISHLNEDKINGFINNTPLKRLGSAEEVSELALFLLSDKSSFITGQIIGADGGLLM